MEILVFVAMFIVLAALSNRFGVDSRDTYRSREEELAERAFTREQRMPIRWEHWTR
jgi:hypothetical protein